MQPSAAAPASGNRGAARHLWIGFAALSALTAGGTIGFMRIAGMSFVEALFMTVTTLSTVGYGEIRPLGDAGRLFASGLIIVGVGAALYTAGAFAEFLIAGRIGELLGRRAMTKTLAAVRDHVIVCGYGRLGRVVGEELARSGVPQVIVEEDAALAARIETPGRPVIVASACDEGVLEHAGVERARAIVAATSSEAINVYIALAAREANPSIAIHARAETEAGARRLRRAGATQVVSPHSLGGQRLAQAILRPAVIDFLELATGGSSGEIDLEEIAVPSNSSLVGARVGDLRERNVAVSVVAIKRAQEPVRLNPGSGEALAAGDRVVVVGDRENVTRLGELASRASSDRTPR
jgi:voltage-gated potassium channel